MKLKTKIISLVVFGGSILFSGAMYGFGGIIADNLKSLITNAFEDNTELHPLPTKNSDPNCGATNFQENTDGWDFSPYKQKDGFYTLIPNTYPSYDAPEIWLNKEISTFFSEIELKAEIRGGGGFSPNLI